MPKAKMPKGFKCVGCGTFHKFTVYVWAHWHERLTHTCECGVIVDILAGNVYPHRNRRGFKKQTGPKQCDQSA